MKYAKRFLVFFLIAVAILGFAGYRYYTGRTYFNTSYVNGNTAGNLYNNGLFCEHDGTIYFSNPDDNYHLYSMDITGGNVKKLQNDIVSYIRTNAKTNDLVLTLGAGTVTEIGPKIIKP